MPKVIHMFYSNFGGIMCVRLRMDLLPADPTIATRWHLVTCKKCKEQEQ